MTDDPDEPLEGDIGPVPSVDDRAEQRRSRAEELRRHEADREQRRRRTNAISARVALILVALLLGFLAYDSTLTALEAHRRGDPWLYPPAAVAITCLLGLIALLTWSLRHRE